MFIKKWMLLTVIVFLCTGVPGFSQEDGGRESSSKDMSVLSQVFGDPDAFFRFGQWTCGKTKDNTFSAWFDDGSSVAINIIKDSNGFWYLKTGGREKIVWSKGSTSPRQFDERPWTKTELLSALPVLPKNAQMTLPSGARETSITYITDYLEIVLTDDGIITLFKDRDTVYFTSRDGKDIQFSADEDEMIDGEETEKARKSAPYPGEEDKPVTATESGLLGKKVKIDNIGSVYSTINRTECLTWPDNKTKLLGGSDGWDAWRPREGDIGTVVSLTRHCSTDNAIAIIKIKDKFVAIDVEGLVYAE